MNWIYWAPLIAASLHIFEEFVFPGNFLDWYKHYKPVIKKSITWRFLLTVNLGLLILCYDIGALGASLTGILLWIGVMAMLAANGIWHLKAAIKTQKYSPGLIIGLLFYLPLAMYGYYYFLSSKQISIPLALVAFAVGASYQLWSNLFHRIRSKSTQH